MKSSPPPVRSVRVHVALPASVAVLLKQEATRQGRTTSNLAGFLLESAVRQLQA